MPIKSEVIQSGNETLVKTYSDVGLYIERDGILYAQAIDPAGLGRTYVETNKPINSTFSGVGEAGADGIGIASIEQKVKSTADDGINVIEVTLTDDTKHTFEVENGSKGSAGANGKDGTNGADGVDGKNGADGKDGTNGVDGADGKDGVNGSMIIKVNESVAIVAFPDTAPNGSECSYLLRATELTDYGGFNASEVANINEWDFILQGSNLYPIVCIDGEDIWLGEQVSLKGADGKSAYAYAVGAGYTGTETEFAASLAAGGSGGTVTVSGALFVTLDTDTMGVGSNSISAMTAAYEAGRPIYLTYERVSKENVVLPLVEYFSLTSRFVFAGLINRGVKSFKNTQLDVIVVSNDGNATRMVYDDIALKSDAGALYVDIDYTEGTESADFSTETLATMKERYASNGEIVARVTNGYNVYWMTLTQQMTEDGIEFFAFEQPRDSKSIAILADDETGGCTVWFIGF